MIFPLAPPSDQIFYFQISSPINHKQTIFTVHIVDPNMKSLLDVFYIAVTLKAPTHLIGWVYSYNQMEDESAKDFNILQEDEV